MTILNFINKFFISSVKVVDNTLGGYAVVVYFHPLSPREIYDEFKLMGYQTASVFPEYLALRTFRTFPEAEKEFEKVVNLCKSPF